MPVDGVRAIYVAGLDRNLGEKQFILEFSRFGTITKVCFPKSSVGTLEGHAMMEYSAPQEAADAVFGMNGMIVGDRDLEVRLLDRITNVTPTIARGKARGGDDL